MINFTELIQVDAKMAGICLVSYHFIHQLLNDPYL